MRGAYALCCRQYAVQRLSTASCCTLQRCVLHVAALRAARCSVACCTLQRCVLHVAALQRCTVAPHRLGAGLTQATAKRLAIEISQRGRVVSSFLLPWHQIGWIDAQTKRQARTASV
jgi:hypothetical protein